jgi:hypothetical protein
MKIIGSTVVSVLISVLVLSVFQPAHSANGCWQSQDLDQRAYCEALYEGKKSCWKIKEKDLRARCQAIAYGENSCWRIEDKATRMMCNKEREMGRKR